MLMMMRIQLMVTTMDKFLGDWNKYLDNEFNKEYFIEMERKIDKLYKEKTIYPKYEDIFKAFQLTQYKDTKVVIIGQDPYHEVGQAHGLAFSVQEGIELPPSLKNIFLEIKNEYGYDIPKSGDLTKWAKEGVLLLNATLTVRKGLANSHRDCGWQAFTDDVIIKLNDRNDPIIFVLWGNFARSKKTLIDLNKHYVLEAPHPSPLSAYNGFFGCGHFKEINRILKSLNKEEIDWRL